MYSLMATPPTPADETELNQAELRLVGVMANTLYHRRAVAQPCVNGDRLSKGRMAKFDPAQIRNSSTDRHKI